MSTLPGSTAYAERFPPQTAWFHAYRVILDTLRVSNITLNQVEGLVQESSMPFVLLGMSFLKRLEIKQDGTNMTLLKKY